MQRADARSEGRRPSPSRWLVAVALFLVVMAGAWAGAGLARNLQSAELGERKSAALESVHGGLEDVLAAQEVALHAARGHFVASEEVTRAEWRDYVAAQEPGVHLPGSRFLAYAQSVPIGDVAAFEADVRADESVHAGGYPDFVVWPPPSGELAVPVTYIEPFDDYQAVLGFDLLSEEDRSEAILRARDTGRLTATAPIVPLVDEDETGVAVLIPIYATEEVPGTVGERRAAFTGIVYTTLLMGEVVGRVLESAGQDHSLLLRDVGLVGQVAGQVEPIHSGGLGPDEGLRRDLSVGGRLWILQVDPEGSNAVVAEYARPTILGGGFLVASLVAAIVLALSTAQGRAQVLATKMTSDLSQSERRFRSLLESAPDAMIIVDQEGTITLTNSQAEKLFGWPREKMLGQKMEMLVPEKLRKIHAAHRGSYSAHPKARAMGAGLELSGLRADGSTFPIEVTLAPMKTDEGVIVSAAIRDVTERKETEKELNAARHAAEEAAKAKSDFLATMSHEIRTPMNAVIGMTSLMLDTGLTPEQRDYAETIRTSGDHLLTIINDILDYSKIESGRLELDRVATSPRGLAEEAIDLVAARAAEKNLEVGLMTSDDTPEGFWADPHRLRQVLLNLLSNAVKFTHKGEVTVSISMKDVAPGRREIHFAIQDTGIGIPTHQMDRLFKAFTQGNAATTRAYGGTGLGLAISKRLIELMGGRIEVDSAPGKGSIFRICLPFDAAEIAIVPQRAASLEGKRALVVDDNATNRLIMRRHLEQWGMKVKEADGALAALRAIQESTFDVAILDHNMPEVSGLELAKQIRALPLNHGIALVMASSLGHQPRTVAPVGVLQAYLAKPVKQAQLRDALSEALGPSPVIATPEARAEVVAKPLRILLVEDNAVNRKVATKMLERMGYSPDAAVNGKEGVAAVARKRYDVVLMDIQMPVMDGFEAAKQIREQHGDDRPRIVAMTAEAMPGDRERILGRGMDDYLAKPVRPEAMAAILDKVHPRP